VIITEEMRDAQLAELNADLAECIDSVERLRTSHDRLLEAAKESMSLLWRPDDRPDVNDTYLIAIAYRKLRTAIEAAEELTP